MIPKPLAVAIVCLVTIVWVGLNVAQFLVPGYSVDGFVHTIFLTVVGGALGLSRKGAGGDPPPPPAPTTPDIPPVPPPPGPPPGPRHAAIDLIRRLRPWRPA